MAKVSAAIRTGQIKKDGKVNIKIRIFHNGDSRYIGTRFNVPVKMFSTPQGLVRKSHPQSAFINRELKIMQAQYEKKLMEMDDLDFITITQLMSRLKEEKKTIYNIFDLFSERIAELKKTPTKKTWQVYLCTKANLKSFTGKEFVSLVEVDQKFLEKFQEWHLKKGNAINTVNVEMRNIRAIFNRAINEGMISADFYPFRKFKIPKQAPKKRSLAYTQISKIYKAELTNSYEIQGRDTFMLIFFLIGINIKDLFLLRPNDYFNGRIYYDRSKTMKEYSILVQPEAKELIEKYRDPDGEWLLNFHKQYKSPYEFMRQTNKFLFRFTPGLKITEKITTYYARHSWATIAFNNGVSKDVVKLALGHGGSSITDLYIDFDLKPVDEANRKVIDLIV
jgi:integrase